MKNALAAALAAVAISGASASIASAEMLPTHQYGHWRVWQGTMNSGNHGCSVSSMGSAPENRYFAIKYVIETRVLTVHISKASWSIPEGTRIPLEIEFTGFPGAWRNERGAIGSGDDVYMSFPSGQRALDFVTEFKRASSGVIRFGGNEGAWTLNLTGSSAAANEMLSCIGRVVERLGLSPTQPYTSAPSQPYTTTRPTAPTLPYTPSTEPSTPPATSTGRERRT